jgi:hypothetical protein
MAVRATQLGVERNEMEEMRQTILFIANAIRVVGCTVLCYRISGGRIYQAGQGFLKGPSI